MNNNIEHQATVDKGLKMKIKRKNVSGANNKAEPKHEIVKSDSSKCTSSSSSSTSGAGASPASLAGLATPSSDTVGPGGVTGATNQGGAILNTPGSTSGNTTANGVALLADKLKPVLTSSSSSSSGGTTAAADSNKQEKSPKMKGSHKKEKLKDKNKNSNNSNSNASASTTNTTTISTTTTTTTTASSSSSSLTTSSSSSSSLATSCVATSCTPSSSISSSSSCPSSSISSSCAPTASGTDCCVPNGSNNNNNTSSSSSSSSSAPTPVAAASITNGLDTSSPVIYNNNNSSNSNSASNTSSTNSSNNSTSMVEPRGGSDVPYPKKENPTPDPYEFNAKVEDGFGIPIKKIKIEKVEAACSPMQPEVHDIGIDTCSVGVITEPECLGPCEPGTSVTLEGIVWHETENAGVLVINVTWRGKTYVGTLLDATKHDWAPPRFNCDSPVSDLESRTPKGRGKRGRGNAATPVNERVNSNNSNNSNSSNANNSNNSNNEGRKLRKGRRCGGNSFQAPPSPAKQEHDRSSSLKRKGRPSDLDLSVPPDSSKGSKRCRSSSRGASAATNNNQNASSASGNGTTVTVVSSNCSTPGESTSPGLLTCPEPNCNKQYKHINGLRYHQSHAHHSAMLQAQEAEENLRDDNGASMEENATDEEIARVRKDESSETPVAKGSRTVKIKEESMSDDNIPADCSLSTEQQSDTASVCPPSSADDSDVQKCVLDKVPSIKIEPCLENIKTEKVTIKTEIHSSCSGPVPPTAAGHTVSNVSKQSLTTQIYQLAAAPMGCLGSGSVAMVTQPNCPINPLATVTSSSTSSPVNNQPLPITVSSMGPISHVSESEKGIKTDKSSSVLDKSKVKTPTRPIVPAPTPQVVAFAGGVGSNHPSLTSVPNTHTQASPSLKPIQPKPTILGEPMNINPALVGLKDKKAKQKKKCKEKDGVKPGELGPMKGDIPKYERTAVIKAVASPPKPGMELSMKKDGGSLMEPPHLTSDLSRPGAGPLGCGNSVIASSQASPKSIDPIHMARMAQPPGLLKVGPSGLLSTPERKTPVNDDVQSPAYSDISDANESGSPSQGDTPVKVKEEAPTSRKQEKHANQNPSDQAAAPVPHYSMYGYYGQSSYLIPNVTQASSPHVSQGGSSVSNSSSGTAVSNHKTPSSAKGDLSSSSSNATSAASSHDEKVSISIDEGIKLNEDKKIKEEKEDPKHKEGAPPGGGGAGGGTGGSSGGASGQVLPPPEYPQKLFPQYYWPQHNTYQYPYGYMEPYAMHFPQYRQYEKVLEDQKRLQQQQQHHQIKELEPVKKPGDYHSKSGLPDESKGPPHSDLPPAMRSIKSSSHGIALKATPADKMADSHKLVSEKSLDRDREQALREKQNENHQILKESIELKPQMDKSRYEMSNLDPYRIHDEIRHSEEMQRYYMFNQQKLIGQEKQKDMQSMESMIPKGSSHKSSEHSRMHSEDIHARETNNSSSSSGGGGGGMSNHNPSKRDLSDNKNKEVVRDINVLGKSMPSDMKSDDKQRVMVMDRMRSPADSQKLKGSYSSSLSASSIPGSSNNNNNNSSSSNISSSPSTNSGSSSSNMTTTTATTTTTTVASTGSANYPHYLSYPYVQTPAYGQLHFDPYRPFNLGYANPSYLHPTHLAYRVNPNEPEKEEKIPNPPKTLLNQPVIGGSELESFKSSEVIHHSPSTPYFGVHKMHELQEKPLSSSRPSPSSSSNCRSSPHTKSSISETSVSPSPNFEKSRDYQNSPPTQRHVHTHHHTHVVGATFPLYPPFTNK